jgi:hypothetical protein
MFNREPDKTDLSTLHWPEQVLGLSSHYQYWLSDSGEGQQSTHVAIIYENGARKERERANSAGEGINKILLLDVSMVPKEKCQVRS